MITFTHPPLPSSFRRVLERPGSHLTGLSQLGVTRQERRAHAKAGGLATPRRLPAAAAAATAGQQAGSSSYDALLQWCIEQGSLPPLVVEPASLEGAGGTQRPGFVAAGSVAAGDVLLQIPGDLAVTSVDVDKDPALAAVAEGRSELVGLALWLMQERGKVRRLGTGPAWLQQVCAPRQGHRRRDAPQCTPGWPTQLLSPSR